MVILGESLKGDDLWFPFNLGQLNVSFICVASALLSPYCLPLSGAEDSGCLGAYRRLGWQMPALHPTGSGKS